MPPAASGAARGGRGRPRFGPTSLAEVFDRAAAVGADQRGSVRLRLDDVDPSPRALRTRLDVSELKASLQQYGQLQPILVRRRGGRYVVVAGHRRYLAARELGWSEIEAIVRDESEDDAYLLTLTENLQRENLTPKEESAALEALVRERGWSVRQVAEAINRSPAYVSKRLRVFEDAVLGPLVLGTGLAVSTAEELLAVSGPEREALARRAAEGRWDRNQARQAVVAWKAAQRPPAPAPALPATPAPDRASPLLGGAGPAAASAPSALQNVGGRSTPAAPAAHGGREAPLAAAPAEPQRPAEPGPAPGTVEPAAVEARLRAFRAWLEGLRADDLSAAARAELERVAALAAALARSAP